MKKGGLILLIGLSVAICLHAEAKEEKVIYYDYTRQDYLVNSPEDLVNYFQKRGFTLKNSIELKEWMSSRIKEEADKSVVVMAMGTVPSEVVESLDNNCTFFQYLKAGGKAVWLGGGMPLSVLTYPDKNFEVIGKEGIEKVLGVRSAKEGVGKQANITEEGKKWGMTEPGDDYRAVAKEDVTLAFSQVGSRACSWLKNFNPRYPFSGFIRYLSEYDGKKENCNEDAYRLALFAGEEVIISEPKEKVFSKINLSRHTFLRGEIVKIPIALENFSDEPLNFSLIWTIKDGKTVVREGEDSVTLLAHGKKEIIKELKTSTFASLPYEFEVKLVRDSQTLTYPRRTWIYLNKCTSGQFPFGVVIDSLGNTDFEIAGTLRELQRHNITHISPHGTASSSFLDLLAQYGISLIPIYDFYFNPSLADSHPEARMKLSNGQEIGIITKHELCFNHPLVQEEALKRLRGGIKAVKDHPAFSGYCFFDDDTFLYNKEGAISCYCQTCTEKFREKTGIEPPKSNDWPERYGKSGIIPEDDPWLLWTKFRCFDTYGNYHQILEDEKNKIDPQIKIGPLHGLGQFPFFILSCGLYPPSDLGPLSLLSSYYYPSLFRQLKDCIYHSDLAFMGNREKELFVMPQAIGRCYIVPKEKGTILKGEGEGGEDGAPPGWFIRNQFYQWIAGGAKGIIYFYYPALKGAYGQEAYEEMKSLGEIAKRYGPLLKKMERSPKEVAVWVSFINNNCFDTPIGGVYRTLLESHLPVETVADEEIAEGRLFLYKVLVLERINYLTKGIYQQIEEYMKKGGKVIIDRSSKLEVPGAILVRTPEELVTEVKEAVKPEIEVDSQDVIIRSFQGEGVTYLWLVNSYTDNWVIGTSLYNTPVEPKAVTINLKLSKKVHLYDLLKSKELSPEKNDDIYKITVEPAGGTLLALYPESIGGIELKYPKEVKRGDIFNLQVDLSGVNAGLQPLEIKIVAPGGKDSEYSTVGVARKGIFKLEFLLAENDEPGNWKITITELSSGKKKEGGFSVK